MTTETSTKKEVLGPVGLAIDKLEQLMAALNDDQVNKVPYKDSWTPAQLFRHVSKSLGGMTKAMDKEGIPAGRDPGERIPLLKETFTDYSKKLKSPEFIVPEPGPYEKEAIMDELKSSFDKFESSTTKANLDELLEGLPLGPVTKLEILHFTLFHTERHLHQMNKISQALK